MLIAFLTWTSMVFRRFWTLMVSRFLRTIVLGWHMGWTFWAVVLLIFVFIRNWLVFRTVTGVWFSWTVFRGWVRWALVDGWRLIVYRGWLTLFWTFTMLVFYRLLMVRFWNKFVLIRTLFRSLLRGLPRSLPVSWSRWMSRSLFWSMFRSMLRRLSWSLSSWATWVTCHDVVFMTFSTWCQVVLLWERVCMFLLLSVDFYFLPWHWCSIVRSTAQCK